MEDILLIVYSHLPLNDTKNCALVNKEWKLVFYQHLRSPQNQELLVTYRKVHNAILHTMRHFIIDKPKNVSLLIFHCNIKSVGLQIFASQYTPSILLVCDYWGCWFQLIIPLHEKAVSYNIHQINDYEGQMIIHQNDSKDKLLCNLKYDFIQFGQSGILKQTNSESTICTHNLESGRGLLSIDFFQDCSYTMYYNSTRWEIQKSDFLNRVLWIKKLPIHVHHITTHFAVKVDFNYDYFDSIEQHLIDFDHDRSGPIDIGMDVDFRNTIQLIDFENWHNVFLTDADGNLNIFLDKESDSFMYHFVILWDEKTESWHYNKNKLDKVWDDFVFCPKTKRLIPWRFANSHLN